MCEEYKKLATLQRLYKPQWHSQRHNTVGLKKLLLIHEIHLVEGVDQQEQQACLYNAKIYSLRSRGIHSNHKQKQRRMLCP